MTTVGFIGFGEVAACFSAALAGHGCAVAAYDTILDQPTGIDALRRRSKTGDIKFSPLHEVLSCSELVISTVTSDVAFDVAARCTQSLNATQIFIDLNATSPQTKRDIAAELDRAHLHFVEGAILNAIGVSGANSRILLCGEKADVVAATLTEHGLNAAHYGRDIGRASTFKLLRSIFSKGVEALLLETRIAARLAGLDSEVWGEIVETLNGHDFADVGGNWMRSHGNAYARRYHEMVQVAALVEDLGIEPIMTRATTAFFERSTRLGLSQLVGSPRSADDVLAALQNALPTANSNVRRDGAV